MNKNHSLETFISDIDKITLYGGTISQSECDGCDEEYKEVLFLAQLLAKVDFTTKGQDWMEKMMAEKILNAQEDDKLEDGELDMVAGGLNLNEILDEKE